MATHLLTGHILTSRGLEEGYVIVRDGIVIESGRGEPPSGMAKVSHGLIVPGLLDMHTHLGDHGARGDLPPDLASAVHPGGLKDRFLSSERDLLVRSYRDSFKEVARGISRVLDFRERGLKGISVAREATVDPRLKILGRPYPNEDPLSILRACDGFGIPCLSDADPHHREMARDAGKIYAVHASELYREDVGPLLDLDPDLVIHMIRGTDEDLKELVERNIPVCVCPRANAAFSLDVPLVEMVRIGLRIVLGTDNALSARQDMFREMEHSWLLLRRGAMSGTEASRTVLSMATGDYLEGTYLGSRMGIPPSPMDLPARGTAANILVLRVPETGPWQDNPEDHVVRFASAEDVLYPLWPQVVI